VDDPGITFDVAPQNGAAARLVIARRGGDELYRDKFDTSRGGSRQKFARIIARLLGIDAAELVTRCHTELPRLADAADQEAAEKAGKTAAESPPAGQGQPLALAWPEPWPEPVALGDVLTEAVAAIRRYVWCGEHQAVAAALWTAWTYHVDRFDVAPILLVTSPVKRCGKTTLGRVLQQMLPRVLVATSVSPAGLFRTIETYKPTLVLDETDAFLAESEEHRGLLNAGHTRDAAFVIRVEGDDHEPRAFSVFGAKLLLGIGKLAPTIEDRAIILTLERKPRGAQVQRLTRKARVEVRQIAQKLMRWATDHGDQIDPDAEPATPDCLNDRQADNWQPLLVLADLAGGAWPARARAAAVALSVGSDADDDELPIRLLADMQAVFAADSREAIPTSELVDALCKIEVAPWATLSKGRPVTPHKLGRLLGGFGIRPRHRERGNAYLRSDLLPAWERYCPPNKGPRDNNSSQPPDQTFRPSADVANHYEIRI
jgi:putative DNA primase/helicase